MATHIQPQFMKTAFGNRSLLGVLSQRCSNSAKRTEDSNPKLLHTVPNRYSPSQQPCCSAINPTNRISCGSFCSGRNSINSSQIGRNFSRSTARFLTSHGAGFEPIYGGSTFQRVWMSKESGARYPPRMILNRLMTQDDTHPTGMANAGVLLQLMEEAGTILCNNHCSTAAPGGMVHAVQAGLEKVDFKSPIYLGEVVEIEAQIGYASAHSLQVLMDLYATIPEGGGEKRHFGRAKYWYVPLRANDETLVEVPDLKEGAVDAELLKEGEASYQQMKELRQRVLSRSSAEISGKHADAPGSAGFAEVSSTTPSEPRFCWLGDKFVRAGFGMRWMDDVGALSATKHVKYPCLAVSVDSGVFSKKVYWGCSIQFTARPIYASPRSLDIHVTGKRWSVDPSVPKGIKTEDAIEAVFTYVSLDDNKKPREIPPLTFEMESDREVYEQRKKYYEARKGQKDMSAQAFS